MYKLEHKRVSDDDADVTVRVTLSLLRVLYAVLSELNDSKFMTYSPISKPEVLIKTSVEASFSVKVT